MTDVACRAKYRRRGGTSMIVLGSAMLVTVIALSGLMAERIELRIAQNEADVLKARLNAQSAIEMGLLAINQDRNWRSALGNEMWFTNQAIGDGAFTLEATDPADGDITDSDDDSVVLIATGYQGQARHCLQIALTPIVQPLTCLETALHSEASISIDSGTVQCNQTIGSNSDVWAWFSSVDADVEAVSNVWGWDYWGQKTSGVAQRTMPDSGVYDDYLANGTAININSIPQDGSVRALDGVVISPAANPFGASINTNGIYVIDCGNQRLEIRNSRIVGTLVLLNVGGNSSISDSVNWEPAISNYPALLVSGSMDFDFPNNDLDENSNGVNFNPPGTAYQGAEDSDTNDVYPSVIKGLVYVSGNVKAYQNPRFEGVVMIGGQITIHDAIDLTYQSEFYDNPPPGFFDKSQMAIVPQSWKQIVN